MPFAPTRLAAAPLLAPLFAAQLPDGYVDEVYLDGFSAPVGIAFADVDPGAHDEVLVFVWERDGRVWLVEDGHKQEPPLVDITEEVGSWRDFGLLGVALDPAFATNGNLYLYYVVDRHHLLFHGTPDYDPDADWKFAATIGRVTRYTADAATDFHTLVPGSRTVLLGETVDSGVPILHESHGTGALVFGEDGTLLVSSGDGASYGLVDAGGAPGTYWQDGLADGIIRDEENVGAFRSQMVGSLSGKVLRLDPQTGDGVPSNPFFDPAQPRAARSRVWALGLRNPFRMVLRPGTGDPDPAAGRPGALYVGDVGWNKWEELHVVADPGMNLGWPLYEGVAPQYDYRDRRTANRDAPNPLFGQGGCDVEFFDFQDLVRQEREDDAPSFKNPCDKDVPIPPGTPTFMHRRPAIDYHHTKIRSRVPVFDEQGKSDWILLGKPGSPVAGESFRGVCSVAGVWHDGQGLGAPWAGSFFHFDFGSAWARALRFDDDETLLEVLDFGATFPAVFATQHPEDGSLVYVTLDEDIRRIRFLGDGNVAPQAVIDADRDSGAGPLTVRFDATGSVDPEDGLLQFGWDFGDGAGSSEPSPVHTFTGPGGPHAFDVTLTVTDPQGATGVQTRTIHVDNSAPTVAITSIADGATYSTRVATLVQLEASVSDAEHALQDLSWAWQVFLRHDNHEHPEDVDPSPSTSALLTPTPCGGSFYAYRVELTVSDPEGLATRATAWLHPDCEGGVLVDLVAPEPDTRLLPTEAVEVSALPNGPVQRVDLYADGDRIGTVFQPPYAVSWTPGEPGPVVLSALATDFDGSSASSTGVPVHVRAPDRAAVAIGQVRDDASEDAVGRMHLGGRTVVLGEPAGGVGLAGLRFPLDVPRGARIVRAHVQLTAAERAVVPTQLVVRAEASDDAPKVTGDPWNLSSRDATTTAVAWSVEPWRYLGATGAGERSPDLSAVVQEIVDRPGFEAGNALLLLLEGTGERTAEGYGTQGARPALLVVEYGE